MYALQRRAKDCGITVSSLHPGIVSYRIICTHLYLRAYTYSYMLHVWIWLESWYIDKSILQI